LSSRGRVIVVSRWQDARHYAVGATRYLADGWHVSGGYELAESAVPAVTFTPLVPDGLRHSVSAGVGRRAGRWSWDVAYQFTYGPERTITGSTPSAAGQSPDGIYSLLSHGFSVSGTWTF
jgi:long-chain fatty acid transport protein